MITWDFYSKRRRIDLTSFLEGVKTFEDAVEKFRKREITPPESLREFFEKEASSEDSQEDPASTKKAQSQTRSKAASSTSAKRKSTPTKKTRVSKKAPARSSSKKSSDESPEDSKDENEKKQYFRKIIKPEKK